MAEFELSAPPEVLKRWQDTISDSQFQEMYRRWVNSEDTRTVVAMVKEVFCRPVPLQAVDAMSAIRAQGFQEGCWAVIDSLRSMDVGKPILPEPEVDYDGEDENKGKAKRKGKKI